MSERFTEVRMRDGAAALALRGRQTRALAIAEYREFWRAQLKEAQAALDTPDPELEVVTYVGAHVQRGLERVT